MIRIDIKIGDTILTGKWKNKKVVVKKIGTDEFGNPTVNGKSILKIRIPKLYKESLKIGNNMKKQINMKKSQTTRLKLRELIKEGSYEHSEIAKAEKDHNWSFDNIGIKFFGSKNDSKVIRIDRDQFEAIKKIIR